VRLGEKESLDAALIWFEERAMGLKRLAYYQERRLRRLGLIDDGGWGAPAIPCDVMSSQTQPLDSIISGYLQRNPYFMPCLCTSFRLSHNAPLYILNPALVYVCAHRGADNL
jgi:hypothetical protein